MCLCVVVSFLALLCKFKSVWVDEEAGEGAVLVLVSSVDLPSVQLHAHLVAYVQMQDDAVGGVVVVLVCVLSDGACSHLFEHMCIHNQNKMTHVHKQKDALFFCFHPIDWIKTNYVG